MLKCILFFLFFMKQIFNYTFSIYVYSCCGNDFYIQLNGIQTYFRRYNDNKSTFNLYNNLDSIYVTIISNVTYEMIWGFIELENNCTLPFSNNPLINVQNDIFQGVAYGEGGVGCFMFLLINTNLNFNFKLWNVPKKCNKYVYLTDLTYNFDDGFHKYNDTISIQTEKLVKFLENYSHLDYTFFLYVEENDDKNFKLFNENDEELFLNKPIQFRILKIKNFGENYSHRKIKINFFTVDALLNPKSSLSSITFELCGYGCKCSSSDAVNNYCNECLENFAYLEDERDFCQEIEKLKSPYFIHNKEKNSFIHCIFPCKTCENEVDNCTSCADEYNTIKNQTTGKIIKCCPINFNYLIEFSNECTFECNKQIEYKYYDEKEFNCFKSCLNDNKKYTYNDYLCMEKCPNNSYIIEKEKKCVFDLKIINDNEKFVTTSMKIDELYEKLDSYLLEYKKLNKNFIGENFILSVFEINDNLFNNKNNSISKINFSSTFENSIKKYFNLSENKSLLISKIDLFFDNNSTTNEIKLFIYDEENKKKLNIDDINLKNLTFNLSFSLKEIVSQEELKIVNDLFENNIDCFNINDSFFSEICYNNYYNNSYYDLNDKINFLYMNKTICYENCKYNSLKKEEEEIKIICECNLSTTNNFFNEGDLKLNTIKEKKIQLLTI